MKTQSNLVLALLLSIITGFTLAAAPYGGAHKMIVRVEQQNGQALTVQLANLQKQRTRISLADTNGKVWFSDYAWGVNGYTKRLNLDGMPAGSYVLLINNTRDQYAQAFTKTQYQLFFFQREADQNEEKAVAKLTSRRTAPANPSICRITPDKARGVVFRLANLLGAETTLQLKTETGGNLFETVIAGQSGYAKKINLEGMPNGAYYLLIHTGELTRMLFMNLSTHHIEIKEIQQLDHGLLPSTRVSK